MENKFDYDLSSDFVKTHLTMLQAIIARMATNSSACKNWCITVVSAMLIFIIDKNKTPFIFYTLLPIALFLILDLYYLSLEVCFRNSHNIFIQKIHTERLLKTDVFKLQPSGSLTLAFWGSVLSPSIAFFYGFLLTMVFAVKIIIS
jgi:hypothetical protein